MLPWQHIHVDFAGQFLGKMFLIVVDAHSKWPEVIPMATTNTTRTIEEVRKLFTAHGSPEQPVSHNGPQFITNEFRAFKRSNGIKHIRSTPYHLVTTGLVECFAQTFKEALRMAMPERKCLPQKLAKFLLAYKTTPQTTTGETPVILLMERNIRTRLDVLKPNIRKRVEEKEQDQELRSSHSSTCKLDVGQTVVARDYRWVHGVITSHSGPLSYEVRVAPNTVWQQHIDQLREPAITVNPNMDDPATQPNPATFSDTPQSTYNRVAQIPACSASTEAVIPDQDISTMPGNPSGSHYLYFGGRENAILHMFTGGLVNITCPHMPCV